MTCPDCNMEIPEGSKFTSRTAIEGERKTVTILFADVAGSTAMFEKQIVPVFDRDMHRVFWPAQYLLAAARG